MSATSIGPRRLRALLAPLVRRARALLRGSDHAPIGVGLDTVKEVVARHGVQGWFVYAFECWGARAEPRETCRWLSRHLARDARIFEAGCGLGVNLLWFHQRGFSKLYGLDVDAATVEAGEDLGRRAGASMILWRDDGLHPAHLEGAPYDAALILGWSFLLDDMDLAVLLTTYGSALAAGGYLAVEIIDRSYDDVPNNRFLTSDWSRPEAERRPSEYRKRHSRDEVLNAASAAGLCLAHLVAHAQVVPRRVYVLQKPAR